jgi:hypothetical protein
MQTQDQRGSNALSAKPFIARLNRAKRRFIFYYNIPLFHHFALLYTGV